MPIVSPDQRAADLNRSSVPRYIQLATLFRNWIADGRWAVDSRIPTIEELAAEFSVARGTMRAALSVLEDEGQLERLRAKGTFVRAAPAAKHAHKLATDWASLISAHEGATIKVLSEQIATELPHIPKNKGYAAPKYKVMKRLHSRDGSPYLVTLFHLEYEVFKGAPASQFRQLPTLPILRKLLGRRIDKAWQTLTIGMADIDVANLLQIPLNAPVAKVERVAIDRDGMILYLGHGVYRGDSISMEIELR